MHKYIYIYVFTDYILGPAHSHWFKVDSMNIFSTVNQGLSRPPNLYLKKMVATLLVLGAPGILAHIHIISTIDLFYQIIQRDFLPLAARCSVRTVIRLPLQIPSLKVTSCPRK